MTKKQNIAGLEVFSCLPDTPTSRPDLLFIHGAFAGAWMWTETYMPYFADRRLPLPRTVAARPWRQRRSRPASTGCRWPDYVDDVRMVIEALTIDPVLLGPFDGWIRRPEIPGTTCGSGGCAALLSPPPQGLIAAQFHLLLQKPQLYLEINRILAGNYTETDTLKEALFAGEVDQKMLEVWLGRMQNESQRAIWDMSMFNLPNLYCMQKVPMLIVGAEMDALVPAFLAQSTAHTYGEPCHILRGMGHAITHEKDWSKGAALVLNWLETLKP